MTRYTLHVPELLNDGSPVEPWQLDQLELAYDRREALGEWREAENIPEPSDDEYWEGVL